jgi:alpha-1,3/alpha-1,6-mannosyltransferase
MLLSIRGSLLKSYYRKPFDFLEEVTTFMADKIIVNSNFTKSIVQKCFKKRKEKTYKTLEVLYPAISESFLKPSTKMLKHDKK